MKGNRTLRSATKTFCIDFNFVRKTYLLLISLSKVNEKRLFFDNRGPLTKMKLNWR